MVLNFGRDDTGVKCNITKRFQLFTGTKCLTKHDGWNDWSLFTTEKFKYA